MQNKQWLSLSEYSSCYKVSISTLRRRIKAKKAESTYEDGKYYLRNLPLKDHQIVNNTFDDLTRHQDSLNETVIAPPQTYQGLSREKNEVVLEDKIRQDTSEMKTQEKEKVSANVEYLLKELRNAYTLILKEKEEQIILLKDEITDLKMLSRALESRCDQLESLHNQKKKVKLEKKKTDSVQELHPEPVELEYIPSPQLELAHDWLDDDL